MSVDPARTGRALALRVERVSVGRYHVDGGAQAHIVRRGASGWSCDCADSKFNPGPCKHRLARYLYVRLDQRVVEALRSVVDA